MYKKILLPTDGSKYAKKAAKHAAWIAEKSSGEIIVLNVIDTSTLLGVSLEDTMIQYKKLMEMEASEILHETKKIIKEFNEDLKVKTKLKEGHVVNTILDYIKENKIDLVVMGASGKGGLDRLLLGSVSEKITRHATCPVLIVH
ncbi:UspA domain protein [Methanothermus fervidus DSM 2088]|uniref:UspA domain protein n=1 Tax=Methanothermus fervidus (strain ATCC 43054 / DSM 2088 / JCM 10308 / V24 S) TaxID=523846 RepID=E3GY78_METFV|nr:UspA domain protein [Methanothermus fervidus DSM 2088]